MTRAPGTPDRGARGEPDDASGGDALDRPLLWSDVVVQVKDIRRVVLAFDFAQPLMVRTVRRADGVVCLIVAQVVQPPAPAEVLAHRGERVLRPGDVLLGVGG